MRALRAAFFLGVVIALGAVLGLRLAGPGRSTAPVTTARTGNGPGTTAPGTATSGRPAAEPPAVSITVRDRARQMILHAPVGALDPVQTGGGAFAPIDPPLWREPVWARYRPLVPPTDPSRGTSYVYGHACHHHACAFTALERVRVGDTIVVTGDRRRVVYRITSTSADYPKRGPGSLAERRDGVANRSIRNRLVLITCAYQQGDVSLNDFVVIARRV